MMQYFGIDRISKKNIFICGYIVGAAVTELIVIGLCYIYSYNRQPMIMEYIEPDADIIKEFEQEGIYEYPNMDKNYRIGNRQINFGSVCQSKEIALLLKLLIATKRYPELIKNIDMILETNKTYVHRKVSNVASYWQEIIPFYVLCANLTKEKIIPQASTIKILDKLELDDIYKLYNTMYIKTNPEMGNVLFDRLEPTLKQLLLNFTCGYKIKIAEVAENEERKRMNYKYVLKHVLLARNKIRYMNGNMGSTLANIQYKLRMEDKEEIYKELSSDIVDYLDIRSSEDMEEKLELFHNFVSDNR